MWVSFESEFNGQEISVEAEVSNNRGDVTCSAVQISPESLQDAAEDEMAEEAVRRFCDGEFA